MTHRVSLPPTAINLEIPNMHPSYSPNLCILSLRLRQLHKRLHIPTHFSPVFSSITISSFAKSFFFSSLHHSHKYHVFVAFEVRVDPHEATLCLFLGLYNPHGFHISYDLVARHENRTRTQQTHEGLRADQRINGSQRRWAGQLSCVRAKTFRREVRRHVVGVKGVRFGETWCLWKAKDGACRV